MDMMYELNRFFRLHRLFGINESFVDTIDTKSFSYNPNLPANPLLLHVQYGGTITYGIPTTFECIGNPYYVLLYMEHGDVLIKSGESFSMGAKDLLLLKPSTDFRFDTRSTPCHFHMFLLTGDGISLFSEHMEHITFEENRISRQLIYLQRLLQQSGNDIPFLISKIVTNVLTDALIFQEKAQQGSGGNRVPAYMQEMKYIIEHEYNRPLTLDQLEQRLKISKFRLCREFSAFFGQTPLQYLNRYRIDQAKILLEQTDITIHGISYDVGIPNTSHFIKLFKRETKQTPAQYRRHVRQHPGREG